MNVVIKLCDYTNIYYHILLPMINNFILNTFLLCLSNGLNLDNIKKILDQHINIIIDYICISHDTTDINYTPKYNNAVAFGYQKIIERIIEIKGIAQQNKTTSLSKNNTCNKSNIYNPKVYNSRQITDKRRAKANVNIDNNPTTHIANGNSIGDGNNTIYRPLTPEPDDRFNGGKYNRVKYTEYKGQFKIPTSSDIKNGEKQILQNMTMYFTNKSIKSFKKTIELITTIFNLLTAKLFINNTSRIGISKYGFTDMTPIFNVLNNPNNNVQSNSDTISEDTNNVINDEVINILSINLEHIITFIWALYSSISRICNSDIYALHSDMLSLIFTKYTIKNNNTDDILLTMVNWYVYIRIMETMISSIQSSNTSSIPSRALIIRIKDYINHKINMENIIKMHSKTIFSIPKSSKSSIYMSQYNSSMNASTYASTVSGVKNKRSVIHIKFFDDIYSRFRESY